MACSETAQPWKKFRILVLVSRAKIITTYCFCHLFPLYYIFPLKWAYINVLFKCWTSHLRYSPDWRSQREKKMVLRRRRWKSLKPKAPARPPPWKASCPLNKHSAKELFHVTLCAAKVADCYSQKFLLWIQAQLQCLTIHDIDSNQLVHTIN